MAIRLNQLNLEERLEVLEQAYPEQEYEGLSTLSETADRLIETSKKFIGSGEDIPIFEEEETCENI